MDTERQLTVRETHHPLLEEMRSRNLEERKPYSENRWVEELLSGRLQDEQQMQALFGRDFKALNELPYRVCLLDIDPFEAKGESIRFPLSLILRSAFEKFGFRPLLTSTHNRFAVIASDGKSRIPAKTRLRQALESLSDIRSDEQWKDLKLSIGVSQSHTQLKNANAGYREAVQALSLRVCIGKPIVTYEELGVFQLLLGMNDGKTLQTFIRNYLGPLIDHDETRGSELVVTLKVYLDHDGSKQIAAQKLFIVRQSLYYRLEKMAELLGDHFMSPDNRIAIQVALRAYQWLHPEKFLSLNKT